jgi:hypothetical protein
MRALLSAVGTRGDVQPIVALALRVRSLGHEVRLCVPPNFVEWVRGFGFEAVTVGVEIRYPGTRSGSGLAAPLTAEQAPSLDGGLSNDAGAPDAGDAGGNAGIPPGAQLVATTTGVQRLVSDGTNLIWGNGDQLMTVPLTGGSPIKIGSAPPQTGPFTTSSTIDIIAAATGFAYWSYVPSCSNILKTSIDGAQQTKLVDSVTVYAVAVNSTKAFFIAGSGQLLSVAR